MDAGEVRATHAAMKSLWAEKRWGEAAALVDGLGACPAVDVNSVEFVDLWWMFCEELADAVAASDPNRAARLYELALVSWQKDGSYATGAGEGMTAMVNVRRIEEKLATAKINESRVVAAPPKPIDLFVARTRKPETVSDLTTLEREQLRIAWRGFDEEDLDAKAGLTADESERSFLAIVQISNMADADGNPRYDVFTYVDQGAIFRAGTTEEIGGVVQGGVNLRERNDALRVALQSALFGRAAKLETKKGTNAI